MVSRQAGIAGWRHVVWGCVVEYRDGLSLREGTVGSVGRYDQGRSGSSGGPGRKGLACQQGPGSGRQAVGWLVSREGMAIGRNGFVIRADQGRLVGCAGRRAERGEEAGCRLGGGMACRGMGCRRGSSRIGKSPVSVSPGMSDSQGQGRLVARFGRTRLVGRSGVQRCVAGHGSGCPVSACRQVA
jgi:hypothetical protein